MNDSFSPDWAVYRTGQYKRVISVVSPAIPPERAWLIRATNPRSMYFEKGRRILKKVGAIFRVGAAVALSDPAVGIFDPHDVVLAQIGAGLHFDQG